MGFLSCVGRTLFVSFFLFTAWKEFNDFGVNGGAKAKALRPKIELLNNHLNSTLGVHFPENRIKNLVAAGIALKGTGGILFILGSPLGANLLLLHQAITAPILRDFYHHPFGSPGFYSSLLNFTQELSLCGALLIFLGMRKSMQRRQSRRKPTKSKSA